MLGVGSSGGGGVSSWNGRTGAVVPASGDYSFSLISGIASISQIPSLASLYIQNTTTQQATSNFNISGNGTAAGMLTGTTAVNTGGYYQISGSNFLSGTSDGKSISLGIGTGAPISGGYNTFVGGSAGALTTGPSNTFVGALTGEKLTSGTANTFMGYEAGVAATTANYDIFIGQGAGTLVTTGSSDIYIGYTNGGTENNTIRIGTQVPAMDNKTPLSSPAFAAQRPPAVSTYLSAALGNWAPQRLPAASKTTSSTWARPAASSSSCGR